MRTVVKGGIVVNAAEAVRADVLVVDERVAAIQLDLPVDADRTIDASGRYVIPGGVDVHTHMQLETSGTVACDDFATGTAAAAWGGTTTIIDYAGHERGESPLAGLARWEAKAAGRAHIDYGFHMMLSEVTDRVLDEFADLIGSGVTSVKVFMAYPDRYMVDDAAILQVLRRAGGLGVMVAVHAENGGPIEALRAELVHAGHTEPGYHARSRPPALEGEATGRVIVLAGLAQAPVYIAHLSAAPALEAVHAARDRGQAVFAETCPQYLFLDEARLCSPDGELFVCSPPLRPAETQVALWQGLRRRDIDVVATDHCPFTAAQKAVGRHDFTRIPNGLHGVEERLSLVYEGVHRGELGLTHWVDLLATRPARLFGLAPQKGALVPGADADLVVFNPNAARTLSAATHHSAVDYSIYEGMTVHGTPELVMQRGHVLVDGAGFHARPGAGRYLRRSLPQL